LMVGIIIVVAILPTIYVQWKGRPMREKRAEDDLDQVNTITR
jgi:hypothetical protein